MIDPEEFHRIFLEWIQEIVPAACHPWTVDSWPGLIRYGPSVPLLTQFAYSQVQGLHYRRFPRKGAFFRCLAQAGVYRLLYTLVNDIPTAFLETTEIVSGCFWTYLGSPASVVARFQNITEHQGCLPLLCKAVYNGTDSCPVYIIMEENINLSG